MLPAPRFFERLGRRIESLDHVTPERPLLLEQTLGYDLGHAVVHRIDDTTEIAGVDESESALTCENREVDPQRVDVKREAARYECSVNLAQDVHDVLRLYSSERPGKERQVELALRELELGGVGNLEPETAPQLPWSL